VLAVHAEAEQGQRMHRLVEPERLDIGPVEEGEADVGHLLRVGQRPEFDEFRIAGDVAAPDQLVERKAGPGNDGAPAFDAAHPVDALLERRPLQDVVDGEGPGRPDLALDADRPRPGAQAVGVAGRAVLVGPELVEVAVFGDRGVGRGFFVSQREGAGNDRLEAHALAGCGVARSAQPASRGAEGRGAQELAAPAIDFGRGDRGGENFRAAPDQHGATSLCRSVE
jgi:hypothetical protein